MTFKELPTADKSQQNWPGTRRRLRQLLNFVTKALPLKRRYIPVGLTLGVGTVLSVVACVTVWNWEQKSLSTQFQSQADKLATAMQGSIDRNLEILHSTGKLYVASQTVERSEFKSFVTDYIARYPSLLGMNWTLRVSAKERQAFERATQAEGFPNFQITERSKQGQIVRSREHREYFAIYYYEPAKRSQGILGFDLNSDPLRRVPLAKARDTGAMTATGRIRLLSTNDIGFLTLQPIYRQRKPFNTLAERRENLRGFVTAVFAVADIVKATLSSLDLKDVDFYLFDDFGKPDDRFLSHYRASTNQVIADPSRERALKIGNYSSLCWQPAACTRRLQFADRQWSLLILPSSEYTGIGAHWRAWTTLCIGLLLTAILAIYLLMSLRHTVKVEQLVQERTTQANQLAQALYELKQTQAQLIQTEKMSSLGQLVAGVAHEINNPVNFISGNLNHAEKYIQDLLALVTLYQQHCQQTSPIQEYIATIDLDFLMEDIPKLLSSMKVGAERILQIVISLRNFSRLDEAEMKQVDIHEGIDSTLMILQSRLKGKPDRPNILVIKEYGDLPLVECYPGQLNQVFMNILSNAIDALEELAIARQRVGISKERKTDVLSPSPQEQIGPDSGNGQRATPTITIRTLASSCDRVTVKIADNGPGMTEAIKARLFDPFFTTKPVGQGTGLGLSISYQIVVERHRGTIQCVSMPGQGAEFWIEIPMQQRHS